MIHSKYDKGGDEMTEKKCNDCGQKTVIDLLTLVENEWKCYSCKKNRKGE